MIDLQPLYPTQEYSDRYIEQLTPIRDKYPDLQGVLSGKIYDDTSFFSKNMLFGRFTDESKLSSVVQPAFEEYLEAFLSLMDTAKPNSSMAFQEAVEQRQREYDIYSALKDPAVGLFDAYFGKEWSSVFVHDFLFSLSKQQQAFSSAHKGTENSSDGSKKGGNVHTFKIDQSTGELSPVSSNPSQKH